MSNTRLKHLFFAAMSWALLATHAEAATVRAALQNPSARTEAPPFHLVDASGRTVKLADYRGKVVLLNFWATDCGGCRIEIPWLVEIDKEVRNKNAALIGISMDISYEGLKNAAEAWAKVNPFVAGHQIGYLMLIGDEETTRRYNVQALPASYLIDSHGRIAATYIGLIDEENVKANINTLLVEDTASRDQK